MSALLAWLPVAGAGVLAGRAALALLLEAAVAADG